MRESVSESQGLLSYKTIKITVCLWVWVDLPARGQRRFALELYGVKHSLAVVSREAVPGLVESRSFRRYSEGGRGCRHGSVLLTLKVNTQH